MNLTELWMGFVALVGLMLWLDLGVLNRAGHVPSTRQALRVTALWVGVALGFAVFVFMLYDRQWCGVGYVGGRRVPGLAACGQFLTGYIVEYSLSLDNVFVIALIFGYFRVPPEYQHRTLFWGILGAMIFRGIMIGAGAALIARFDWMMTVFGVILLVTAVRMLFSAGESGDPDKNPLVRLVRRFYPVTAGYEGEHFFARLDDGRRAVTPLLLVLVVVESTDVLFAVDSIPAIFGVTRDPFLVFTSNVFAILGLRSLYFVLAGMMAKFKYVKPSLVFVLLFIAVKMLLPERLRDAIPDAVELGVILGILAVGVTASLVSARRLPPEDTQPVLPGEEDVK